MKNKLLVTLLSVLLFSGCAVIPPRSIALGEVFEMKSGQRVRIANAGLSIRVVSYTPGGPDCPLGAFCIAGPTPPTYVLDINNKQYTVQFTTILPVEGFHIQFLTVASHDNNLSLIVYNTDDCLSLSHTEAKTSCIMESKNIMHCLEVSDSTYRTKCIGILLNPDALQDAPPIDIDRLCQGYEGSQTARQWNCMDEYYRSWAIAKKDVRACDHISASAMFDQYDCYKNTAVILKDATICAQIPAAVMKPVNQKSQYSIRDDCYRSLASYIKEKKWCEHISDPETKKECLK